MNKSKLVKKVAQGILTVRMQSHARKSEAVWKLFESFAVKSLQKHGMELICCGGPGDRGVDFRGVWNLSTAMNLIGQCRCYKRKLGANHLRELEGTLCQEQSNTLGVIVTNVGFTRDAYQHFISSPFPLVISVLCMSKSDSIDQEINANDQFTRYHNRTQLHLSMLDNENKSEVFVKSHRDLIKNRNDAIQQKTSEKYENAGTWNEELLMFDLNMRARVLLPNVVVAKAMGVRGSSSVLLYENENMISVI